MQCPNPLPSTTVDHFKLELLELQDTILHRIRLESRQWSLRSELAAVEELEAQAREAQVEAERAVEMAKKKTERAAERGRSLKVELRFISEEIADLQKKMEAHKAELIKAPEPVQPAPPPTAVDQLIAGEAASKHQEQQHVWPDRLASEPPRDRDPLLQPIKHEYYHPLFSRSVDSHAERLKPRPAPAATAPQSTYHQQTVELFGPLSSPLTTPVSAAILRDCSPASPRNDTSFWGQIPNIWDHGGATSSSQHVYQPLASPLNGSLVQQYAVQPTAKLDSHMANHPVVPVTDSSSATATATATATDEKENPLEEKSKRLIEAVKELTGKEPEYFFTDDRTFFLAGPLAAVFSPSLKDPNKAASAHARKYGCDASGQFREGVRKQGGRWAMTVEAFEEYVLGHLRLPRFIKY